MKSKRDFRPTMRRRDVFLVHGEPEQQRLLHGAIEAKGMRVCMPKRGESVELA
ncbi:MAG: hypothetical protein MUF34_28880 [Polyangiaceae bacterium]|nr:hypothetical protein [Polyangiaceae bacterium]